MKIRLMGAELFHVDGHTDGRTDRQVDRHDEANSRFSQCCERAEKCIFCVINGHLKPMRHT
jgi:hypothetical protein